MFEQKTQFLKNINKEKMNVCSYSKMWSYCQLHSPVSTWLILPPYFYLKLASIWAQKWLAQSMSLGTWKYVLCEFLQA